MQFHEYAANHELATIWKTWAPPKCKFFTWLIFQDRVWTSERLARRNWDHNTMCPLCRVMPEMMLHLLEDCRYSRRVWNHLATWLGLDDFLPTRWTPSTSTSEWWVTVTLMTSTSRKGSLLITLLVSWEIWKERNNRIFDRRESSVLSLVNIIKAEASLWVVAGAKCLTTLLA